MDALTTKESELLRACEAIIEKGQQTFVEVGEAVAQIRDQRLYRATHKTFEAYCQERWGWTASRSRQYIAASGVVKGLAEQDPKSVTTVTLSEWAARELVPVPAQDRPGVLEKAAQASKGGKVTAAALKEAKAQSLPRPAYGKPVVWTKEDLDGPAGGTDASPSRKKTGLNLSQSEQDQMLKAFGSLRRLLYKAGLESKTGDALETISKAIGWKK